MSDDEQTYDVGGKTAYWKNRLYETFNNRFIKCFINYNSGVISENVIERGISGVAGNEDWKPRIARGDQALRNEETSRKLMNLFLSYVPKSIAQPINFVNDLHNLGKNGGYTKQDFYRAGQSHWHYQMLASNKKEFYHFHY